MAKRLGGDAIERKILQRRKRERFTPQRARHDAPTLRLVLFLIVARWPCEAPKRLPRWEREKNDRRTCAELNLKPCAACIAGRALEGKGGW